MLVAHRTWYVGLVLASVAGLLASCSSSGGKPKASGNSSTTSSGSTISIGLIDDLTGPSSLFGPPTTNVAKLAIAEINRAGGINGKMVNLLTENGATDAGVSKAGAQRLISQDHVSALFTMFSSAQNASVQTVADAANVPYYYTPVWQGGVCDANGFFNGEVPSQQLAPVIPWVMQQTGKKKWYLLGNDYIWPHESFKLAKQYIAAAGGTVVGEDYVPLGTTDFTAEISKVQSSGADIMIPALVGSDAIAFEKQAYDSGLGNDKVQRLAILYEDNTRAAMGAKVTNGMYFSTGYDQVVPSSANSAFLDAYQAQFGSSAAPVTTLSEHAYAAIKAWAQAANAAHSTTTSGLAPVMSTLSLDTPGGRITYDGTHYATQNIYVVKIGGDGKASVVQTFDNVAPSQKCSF